MLLGIVVSNVWSTRKEESLTGIKFMIVEILENMTDLQADDHKRRKKLSIMVAADLVGAGIGEKVLVSEGSSARRIKELADSPIDAAIIGIIDEEK